MSTLGNSMLPPDLIKLIFNYAGEDISKFDQKDPNYLNLFTQALEDDNIWRITAKLYGLKLTSATLKPRDELTQRILHDVEMLDLLFRDRIISKNERILNPFERFDRYRDYLAKHTFEEYAKGLGPQETESREDQDKYTKVLLRYSDLGKEFNEAAFDAGMQIKTEEGRTEWFMMTGMSPRAMLEVFKETNKKELQEVLINNFSALLDLQNFLDLLPTFFIQEVPREVYERDARVRTRDLIELVNWTMDQIDLNQIPNLQDVLDNAVKSCQITPEFGPILAKLIKSYNGYLNFSEEVLQIKSLPLLQTIYDLESQEIEAEGKEEGESEEIVLARLDRMAYLIKIKTKIAEAQEDEQWKKTAKQYGIELVSKDLTPKQELTQRITDDVKMLDLLFQNRIIGENEQIKDPFKRFERYRNFLAEHSFDELLEKGPKPTIRGEEDSKAAWENVQNLSQLHGDLAEDLTQAAIDAGMQFKSKEARSQWIKTIGTSPNAMRAIFNTIDEKERPDELASYLVNLLDLQYLQQDSEARKYELFHLINWIIPQIDLTKLPNFDLVLENALKSSELTPIFIPVVVKLLKAQPNKLTPQLVERAIKMNDQSLLKSLLEMLPPKNAGSEYNHEIEEMRQRLLKHS